MKNRTRKRRVLLWAGRLLLAVSGIGVSGYTASGQGTAQIPKSYLNKGTVHLPIQIDDRVRPTLQEVQLWVKESPQTPWALKEKVPGTQTFFTFRAAHDGEYWFNVVTVDRAGRAIPADVTKEQPGLIVVIDSTPPRAEPKVLAVTPEGQQVRCEINDANPDPAKTRLFYQTRDQIWRSLDSVSGKPDTFCIPAQAAISGMIRVSACDLAGNTTTREFNLATLPVSNPSMPPVSKNAGGVVLETTDKGLTPPPLPESVGAAPSLNSTVLVKEKIIPYSERSFVVNKLPAPSSLPTPGPELASKTPFSTSSGSDIQTAGATFPVELPSKRHIVNNTHVFLDYQIDQTGPSGVGRVEIWYTRDMGQNWQKLGVDPNRKGQAEADLPGEGVYGLSIIVANGRGFGANAPQSGDTPDCWVEVDTTKPRAELLNVRSNPNGDDGSLHITWSAKDKNIHPEPIDLYYSVNRQGPWVTIVKGLKNDGIYRWVPGSDIGSHAYIRLTVHDLAGNMASSESVQPVALDDLSRPRSRVVGVTTTPRSVLGSNPSPLPPSGN